MRIAPAYQNIESVLGNVKNVGGGVVEQLLNQFKRHCSNCEREAVDLYEVSFQNIVRSFERGNYTNGMTKLPRALKVMLEEREKQLGRPKIPYRNKVFVSNQEEMDDLLEFLDEEQKQQDYRNLEENPMLITKVWGPLDVKKYQLLKRNYSWLNYKTNVCEECYLLLTQASIETAFERKVKRGQQAMQETIKHRDIDMFEVAKEKELQKAKEEELQRELQKKEKQVKGSQRQVSVPSQDLKNMRLNGRGGAQQSEGPASDKDSLLNSTQNVPTLTAANQKTNFYFAHHTANHQPQENMISTDVSMPFLNTEAAKSDKKIQSDGLPPTTLNSQPSTAANFYARTHSSDMQSQLLLTGEGERARPLPQADFDNLMKQKAQKRAKKPLRKNLSMSGLSKPENIYNVAPISQKNAILPGFFFQKEHHNNFSESRRSVQSQQQALRRLTAGQCAVASGRSSLSSASIINSTAHSLSHNFLLTTLSSVKTTMQELGTDNLDDFL